MEDIDLKKFTLPPSLATKRTDSNSLPKHGKGDKFLRGPIPMNWLSMAAKISGKGKALHVAIAIWFHAGIQNNRTITLSGKTMTGMGVDRYATYRGLKVLEKNGLISVSRHCGRLPIVTILEWKG